MRETGVGQYEAWIGLKGVASAFFGLLVLGSGCVSPNPAGLALTERDKQVYLDKGAVERGKGEKSRVAVIVSQGNYKEAKEAAEALDGTLTGGISGLAFFQLVERSNLGALAQEELLTSLGDGGNSAPDIPAADYLITAKINTFRIDQAAAGIMPLALPQKSGNTAEPLFDVAVSVDFRFYQIDGKRVILTKNIEKKYPGQDKTSAMSKAAVAAQECAKAFVSDLGARYAPPARVLETRGEGQVARVSMGADSGAAKGVKVEFFEYADQSDIIKGAEREPSIVAHGTVIDADTKSAWVEIENYKKAQVKRGHYVKIRFDQSKGFRDQFNVNNLMGN
jgi:curli biogenesis system outer membrane secretion channel CsgG